MGQSSLKAAFLRSSVVGATTSQATNLPTYQASQQRRRQQNLPAEFAKPQESRSLFVAQNLSAAFFPPPTHTTHCTDRISREFLPLRPLRISVDISRFQLPKVLASSRERARKAGDKSATKSVQNPKRWTLFGLARRTEQQPSWLNVQRSKLLLWFGQSIDQHSFPRVFSSWSF